MHTPILNLFIKQFLLKNCGPTDQLLANKRDHRQRSKRDGDTVMKGTTTPMLPAAVWRDGFEGP